MLCENIKKLRKNKGLSQSELAKKVGLTRRIISAIERGESDPSLKQVGVLSVFFDVSNDFLINGNESALNANEREIIKAVRDDKNLFDKLMQLIASKNDFESLIA